MNSSGIEPSTFLLVALRYCVSVNYYTQENKCYIGMNDRLYGLVFRVPGYRSRDPGFDSRACYQIF
jgi:hypothetical protein